MPVKIETGSNGRVVLVEGLTRRVFSYLPDGSLSDWRKNGTRARIFGFHGEL